jgi:transposase
MKARGDVARFPSGYNPWVSFGIFATSRTTEQSLEFQSHGQRVKKTICGVDVSKAKLDGCIEPGHRLASFNNDTAGIAERATFCREHAVDLVVMEASGDYERRPFIELWEKGISCALTNPRNVRATPRRWGILEKTDRIDASVIARFAHAKNLAPTPLPSQAQQRRKALVTRLRQVTGDLTVQRQRHSALVDNPETLASVDEVIALLKRQSRSLEGEIASMIDDDPLWAKLAETWREAKGIAGRTVARLHAELPEIGLLSSKVIAIAGLAPIANDSGKRSIRGGPPASRSILFLVAAPVARYDRSLGEFRDRLRKAGKEKMVIRIALARKLLVRLTQKLAMRAPNTPMQLDKPDSRSPGSHLTMRSDLSQQAGRGEQLSRPSRVDEIRSPIPRWRRGAGRLRSAAPCRR